MSNFIEEQNTNSVKSSNRIDFITWLQFIGVIAVIFGHSMNDINVISTLKDIKAWIYTFHMPLFFFVSAFLFAIKSGYDKGYKNVLTKRFTRLLIPYFIWNLLFIVPKIVMSQYVNDQVVLTPEYFLEINLSPRNNILGHTWFLFALFEMFILAIAFDRWRRNKMLWLPIAAFLIVVYCFGIQNRFLAIGDLMKNGIYFWLGLVLGSFELDKISLWLNNKSFFVATAFNVVGMSVIWFLYKNMAINTLMLGINILIFLCLLQQIKDIRNRFIDFVSKNSFAIYILHWPIMGIVRFFVKNKLHMEPHICMILMLIGGIILPSLIILCVRKTKLPFIKYVNKYMLGM